MCSLTVAFAFDGRRDFAQRRLLAELYVMWTRLKSLPAGLCLPSPPCELRGLEGTHAPGSPGADSALDSAPALLSGLRLQLVCGQARATWPHPVIHQCNSLNLPLPLTSPAVAALLDLQLYTQQLDAAGLAAILAHTQLTRLWLWQNDLDEAAVAGALHAVGHPLSGALFPAQQGAGDDPPPPHQPAAVPSDHAAARPQLASLFLGHNRDAPADSLLVALAAPQGTHLPGLARRRSQPPPACSPQLVHQPGSPELGRQWPVRQAVLALGGPHSGWLLAGAGGVE